MESEWFAQRAALRCLAHQHPEWIRSTRTPWPPFTSVSRWQRRAAGVAGLRGLPPWHASWLNMAESDLPALDRPCLSHRLASLEIAELQVAAWTAHRNQKQATVD